MSKHPAQPPAPARPSGSNAGRWAPLRSGRLWFIAVIGLLTLTVAASAVVVIERRLFPRYWVADDLGPVGSNALTPLGPAPEGMVWVPGGTFWMGGKDFPDAQPVHKVYVDGFWMDKTEV